MDDPVAFRKTESAGRTASVTCITSLGQLSTRRLNPLIPSHVNSAENPIIAG